MVLFINIFAILIFIFLPLLIVTFFLDQTFFIIGLILFASLILISILLSTYKYNWQHYWITNKRVVEQTGLIGHTIISVPLERISDIILTRSFIEKVLGYGSLQIQTLAGQLTYGKSYGSELSLSAVPNPEETQQLIFKLIEEKRRSERLAF